MKESTQIKILNAVKKIIGYKEPMIIPEKYDVKKVKSSYVPDLFARRMLSPIDMRYFLAKDITEELIKNDLIDFSEDIYNKYKVYHAKLLVIKK